MFTWPEVGSRTEESILESHNLSSNLLCCRNQSVTVFKNYIKPLCQRFNSLVQLISFFPFFFHNYYGGRQKHIATHSFCSFCRLNLFQEISQKHYMHLSWDLKKQLSKTKTKIFVTIVCLKNFKFSYDSSYPEDYRNILNHNLRNQKKKQEKMSREEKMSRRY